MRLKLQIIEYIFSFFGIVIGHAKAFTLDRNGFILLHKQLDLNIEDTIQLLLIISTRLLIKSYFLKYSHVAKGHITNNKSNLVGDISHSKFRL